MVAVGGMLVWLLWPRALKLTERDTVVIADFTNTTGDSVFDGTLKQAVAVQIAQSPYLNLVPEERIRRTLQFMGRSSDERITATLGRELCQRANVKALLTGSIASLGSAYVVALEALNCGSPSNRLEEVARIAPW